ncbi:MAG: hypothetical protein ACXADY_10610 [Candidatus Hodarchaeales archaeon]
MISIAVLSYPDSLMAQLFGWDKDDVKWGQKSFELDDEVHLRLFTNSPANYFNFESNFRKIDGAMILFETSCEFSEHSALWLTDMYKKYASNPDMVVMVGVRDKIPVKEFNHKGHYWFVDKDTVEFIKLIKLFAGKKIDIPVYESAFIGE